MSIWPSINDIAKDVKSGKTTALEQVEKSLKQIADKDADFNSVLWLCEERAKQRANEIDQKVNNGEEPGRLAGVPFIAKDNYLVFGAQTTAASNMLKGFEAPYQSTAIEKLEAEGAICVAKANLDAFAHGGSTENSDFGVTKNPHDKTRVAGGSSGGSAAAVALDLAPFAMGSDTGGSIRQPASFCGIVGYKPTYGLVSRSGVVAMASSTDVLGPLTRSVEDSALLLDVVSGKDSLDGTTIDRDEKSYLDFDEDSVKGKKIGIIKEYFGEGVDEGVESSVREAIKKLEDAGAKVEEISLPSLPLALAVYYVVVPAELSSNLSRHDGQRYQYSALGSNSLDESYENSRTQGFGMEAKRRIMIGTHVLSSGYYDAYYKKAQTVRTKLINEFKQAFEEYDFLVGPVIPTVAFKIGELNQHPLSMYLQDIMTVAVSLAGLPAVSLPCGESEGMPVGLQIIAGQKKDRQLLSISKVFEEIN